MTVWQHSAEALEGSIVLFVKFKTSNKKVQFLLLIMRQTFLILDHTPLKQFLTNHPKFSLNSKQKIWEENAFCLYAILSTGSTNKQKTKGLPTQSFTSGFILYTH